MDKEEAVKNLAAIVLEARRAAWWTTRAGAEARASWVVLELHLKPGPGGEVDREGVLHGLYDLLGEIRGAARLAGRSAGLVYDAKDLVVFGAWLLSKDGGEAVAAWRAAAASLAEPRAGGGSRLPLGPD